MPDFRHVIVDRACRLLHPRHLLTAGAHDQALARLLAEAAVRYGATLHVATKRGGDWRRSLRDQAGDACIVHEASPQDAIGLLPVPELCWIDADPNWFTVHGILRSLATQAARLGKPFPVTFVEGAGWPYGRRDGYDDPAAIPHAARHPHEQAGLLPGQSAPAGAAGLHGDRYNASAENEPRNGVLTAVEDFLDGRSDELRLTLLPGFGGLAAIYPRAGVPADLFDLAALTEYALALATSLEATRIDQAVSMQTLHAALERAESLTQTLRAALPELRTAAQRAEAANKDLRAVLRVRQAALQRATSLNEKLRAAPPPQTPDRARVPAWLRPAAHGVKQMIRGRRPTDEIGPPPDAAAPPVEPTDLERLQSSPLFDADWYVATYPDVAESGLDPALHYLRHGAAELRDPGPLFSTADYLCAYEDVTEADLNPLVHYLVSGAAEGRNPRAGRDEDLEDGAPPGLGSR